MLHLLALVLCAAPVEQTFLLTVQGAPMARLGVRLDGQEYLYETTHFLEEGETHFSRRLTLSRGAPTPEVLALLSPPKAGCQTVLEERAAKGEQLCVEARSGGQVSGRLDGVPFVASYERGALQRIELGAARWQRVDQAAAAPGGPVQNPFADGFELTPGEGPPRLVPALEGARVVSPVRPVGAPGKAGRVRCLPLARQWAAGRPGARVVTGLVIEHGRAFPHAWVRESGLDADPSMLPGDELTGRVYVDLPAELAGRTYLELLAGTRAVRGR